MLIQKVTFLFCIQEVPGSNVGWDTACSDVLFYGQVSGLEHCHVMTSCIQFFSDSSFTNYSTICHCTVYLTPLYVKGSIIQINK